MKNLSQYDATGTVDLEDPNAVERIIRIILGNLYGREFDFELFGKTFADVIRAFRGEYPGLLRCDTFYHDLRHAIETGLTMARLLDGYNCTLGSNSPVRIDADHALLGVILALFHDVGMLRRVGEESLWGATLMPVHEERSVEFARDYLATTRLAPLAEKSRLIMATKLIFSIPADWPEDDCLLANMVGSSDLLSQIADRCYIEKCRDFLFLEFGAIGLAGSADTPYPDRETLLTKTPGFYTGLIEKRLEEEHRGVHRVMNAHFAGRNPYTEAIQRNLDYLGEILATQDFSRLRRKPQPFIGD